MDRGVVDSPVILVIKAPNQKYTDQTINCFLNWTVEKLKAHLSLVYPSKPSSKDQRLVYAGKLLVDHLLLRDVLRKQDEYHMLHLVCASRTPPGTPQPRSSRTAGATSSSPAAAGASADSSLSQDGQPTNMAGSAGGLGHRAGSAPPAFTQAYTWNQFPQPGTPASLPAYPMYSPMTLLWWQQVYTRQYYMHYQALAASSHTLSSPHPSAPRTPPAPEERRGDPGRGGEVLNRDWLDWVYTLSRATVLLSIVYFYSSFSRFVMVMGAMLVLYLHQAGWFPFNLENELQNLANQDEMEAEQHREMDDGVGDEDGDSGEEEVEEAHGIPDGGLLPSAWSFITTFFMSLIPEGQPNAVN